MKFTKLHKTLLVFVGVIAAVFFACNEFDYIDQPERVYLDETVEVYAKLRIDPGTNDNNCQLLFAMYAPKSLNLAENANVVFSTLNFAEVLGPDYGVADIKNEKLKVVSTQKAPHSPFNPNGGVTEDQWLTWSDALLNYYGVGENASLANQVEMEWIAWGSDNVVAIYDKHLDGSDTANLYAEVKITFNAGPDELECYLGYAYCNKMKGFYHDQEHLSNAMFKHFVVEKFVAPSVPVMTMIQSERRYGDIFGMEFSADQTALEGESDIYLGGKVVYNGGQVVEIKEAIDANRLNPFTRRQPDGTVLNLYEKYIYPPYLFNLPDGAVIEEVYLWMMNADATIIVDTDHEGNPLFVEQTEGSIHDVVEPETEPEGDDTPLE